MKHKLKKRVNCQDNWLCSQFVDDQDRSWRMYEVVPIFREMSMPCLHILTPVVTNAIDTDPSMDIALDSGF